MSRKLYACRYLARGVDPVSISIQALLWGGTMGKRQEPRHPIRIPVRIFGTDAAGKPFSENVYSFDISHQGARLDGVQTRLKLDEIIGLSHGENKGRFTVKWLGAEGTATAHQVGLVSASPDKNVWDTSLPSAGADSFNEPAAAPRPDRRGPDRRQSADRRQTGRLKCVVSVQIIPDGQSAPIWGKAVDLSSGGCFIEMPIPLQKGTKLTLGIWINENKLRAVGRVVSSRPGFGIGVQFSEMSQQDSDQLYDFLKSITQIPSPK